MLTSKIKKKYYFNIFLNENRFKTQLLPQSQTTLIVCLFLCLKLYLSVF